MVRAQRRNGRSTSDPSPTWAAAVMAGAGLIIGVASLYFGYPGAVLAWLFVLVGAWTAPPAQFTGKKDSAGFPTPAHPGESRAMQRYRFWTDLKYRLLVPVDLFVPGWPIYAAWVLSLVMGLAVWSLPDADALSLIQPGLRHVNAALAVVLVVQMAAARRRHVVSGDVSPGVTFWFLTPSVLKEMRPAKVRTVSARQWLVLIGGVVAAVAAGHAGTYMPSPPWPLDSDVTWPVIAAVAGFAVVVGHWWAEACLGDWRRLVRARNEWAPRWQMLKHDPSPRLVERKTVGSAVVDTFSAAGSMGAMAYWPLGAKVAPTMGSGQQIAILSTPNVDGQGQAQPGTRHPLDFRVVYWPAGQTPDITDPAADPAEVALFFEAAMAWSADDEGYARPILDQALPIADIGDPAGGESKRSSSRQAWGTMWMVPDGPPWEYIRNGLGGPLSGYLGCQVLVDHRNQFLYAGGLTDGTTVLDPATGVDPQVLANLEIEDEWNARWADALKRDANPPRPDHNTLAEGRLSNGQVVHRQAFVTRQGVDPTEFFELESKVAATLSGAPFVAITGWPSQGRSGERHAQAFTVYWSDHPVPANPDQVAPPQHRGAGQSAQQWVLSGRLNQAFKAARLAKPEVYEAKCLTRPNSPGHIWSIALRLYGGVTLADVRGAANRIRQALGSEWLRVEEAPDGCVIAVGASPTKVELLNPQRDGHYIAAMDWEQAFLAAKVVGVGSITPTLKEVSRLPHNEQVQVLDFSLPDGLSPTDVKAARAKLETSSKNAFVEILPHPSGKAGVFRMFASEVNPMPERVAFDYAAADTDDHRIPFATGITGEPVCYDKAKDAMVLVSGQQGAGKSVALQNILYGAAIREWGVWIADPSKGGVDFNFAGPYARAFATTVWQAAGMMKDVYAEVVRRKTINSAHNCGNYRDLPDEVRYPHQLVMLDEFTSLMIPEALPKVLDDSPESARELELAKAANAAKSTIATYVGKMVREARSTGFTVVLATQALKQDTIDKMPNSNDLKDNLSRMIVGRASQGQMMSALKQPSEAPPQPDAMPPGRGLYEGNGTTAQFIQTWFERSQATFGEQIAERRDPLPETERLDMSSFAEPDLLIDGVVIDAPSPRPDPFVEEERDLGVVELELDDEVDWDALAAEAEDSSREQPRDDGEAQRPPEPREATLVPPQSLSARPEDTGQAVDASPPAAPRGEHDTVAVADRVVWDEIDPSQWLPAESAYGWVEIDALLAFLDDFRHVEYVEWNDSTLDEHNTAGSTFRAVVDEQLKARGVRLIAGAAASPFSEQDDEFGPPARVPARLLAGGDF